MNVLLILCLLQRVVEMSTLNNEWVIKADKIPLEQISLNFSVECKKNLRTLVLL